MERSKTTLYCHATYSMVLLCCRIGGIIFNIPTLYQRYLAWGAAAEPLYNRGVPA